MIARLILLPKKLILYFLRRFLKIDITHYSSIGENPLNDMKEFLIQSSRRNVILFDVGSNIGNSVKDFKAAFPASEVHAFEPIPDIFNQLKTECQALSGVSFWNLAMGDKKGKKTFYQNEISEMSSVLPLGEDGWGKVSKEIKVEAETVDSFADKHNIEFIDILKADIQGYEYALLQGAKSMIAQHRIGMLYLEICYTELYKGMPPFYEIFKWMAEHNYRFVETYDHHIRNHIISWADGLWISDEYYSKKYS